MPNECIFCKIVRGEIPSTKIFESEKSLAFLDISPAARGHALVIPKNHAEFLTEMNEEDLKDLILAVKKVAKAVVASAGAQGFNVIQSNHKIAGQVIPHVHFHIIPRKASDELSFAWKHIELDKEEIAAFGERVKENLE
ncbi:MAG: HIT family protein [Candidatus Diapherotrites archaeon]|nr:HIT family protein [Candidatus Diapherotrites archaeon]